MLPFFESYRALDVPASLKDDVSTGDPENEHIITNVNRINIFVGPNNSGKSLIAREILKSTSKKYYSSENWAKLKNAIDSLLSPFLNVVKTKSPSRYPFIISTNKQLQYIDFFELENIRSNFEKQSGDFNITLLKNQLEDLEKKDYSFAYNQGYYISIKKNDRSPLGNSSQSFLEPILNEARKIQNKIPDFLNEISNLDFFYSKNSIEKIYIPSIRTLRPFGNKADIKFETIKEYKFDDSIRILNGQTFPNEIYTLSNSSYEERQKKERFEEFLGIEFFDSKKVTLTYDKKNEILLIKIGEEKERPIHELGDGLQMIIILTYPFYFFEVGKIIIEEPEMFMHPGLQKSFMHFLLTNVRVKNFQVFISTHSNHIIDSINISNSISIFSIRKELQEPNNNTGERLPKFLIENVAFGNNNLLSLLGITTTSVYLSNCTIWVEGITDKIYISKFISEYLKQETIPDSYKQVREYKEGINYSFSFTGGDSIIHWDFSEENEYKEIIDNIIVRKFCSKALVIVDNDFGKNSERKKRLKEVLSDRFIVLSLPEIENFLSKETIFETLKEYPTVEQKKDEVEKNYQIIKYKKNIKIGAFIDNYFLKGITNTKKFSSKRTKSGSLKSTEKFSFCNKAINHITSTQLTNEAIELVKKILDFIIAHNKIN